MRILVVERAHVLRDALQQAGYEVSASLMSPLDVLSTIDRVRPDVIVIHADSRGRETLEHVVMVSRPVVIFASDGTPEAIREAVRAGVSAYVVDGLDPKRIRTIIDVAVARFEEFQRLRMELAEANLKLSQRKLIERAKGIVMKTRRMDEDAAYAFLRKAAMDRKLKIGEVAQQLIDAADLLGA